MRCIHPLSLVLDGKRQFVPCGKCNFCLEARRASWSFRLQQELKHSTTSYFLTLTYDDSNLPRNSAGHAQLSKRDVQLFKKRLRKEQSALSNDRLRYYTVGEYGTNTQRPHYHSIMFNLVPALADRLEKIWQMGMVYVGTVTPASIHYVAKYHVNAVGDLHGREPPFLTYVSKAGYRRWLFREDDRVSYL